MRLSSETESQDCGLLLCLVADDSSVDRYPISLRYLQIGLIDESVETVLIVPADSKAVNLAAGPTRLVTYPQSRWPLSLWMNQRVGAGVCKQIRAVRERPTIVQAIGPASVPLAADVADSTGADLIVNVSSPDEAAALANVHGHRRIAAIVAPSEGLASAIKGLRLPCNRVERIAPGLPVAAAPSAFRDMARAPSLLYAGPLTPDCGLEPMLRAAHRVLQRYPNLLVILLGKGPSEASLRRTAESLQIDQSVVFTGRLEQWEAAMASADVFCLPASRGEFREELLDAQAAGLAIAMAESTLYEGLSEGQSAVFFRPYDEAQMAERLLWLLDNRQRARTLAATAQANARSRHSIARMIADYEQLYRDLASRRSTYSVGPERTSNARRDSARA